MKKLSLLLLCLLIGGALFAQTPQAFVHARLNDIIVKMPAYIKAEKEMADLVEKLDQEFATFYTQYFKKKDSLSSLLEDLYDRKKRMDVEIEIGRLENQLAEQTKKSEQEVADMQRKLMAPIYKSLENAMGAIRSEHPRLTYVYSENELCYTGKQSFDISSHIEAKLGIATADKKTLSAFIEATAQRPQKIGYIKNLRSIYDAMPEANEGQKDMEERWSIINNEILQLQREIEELERNNPSGALIGEKKRAAAKLSYSLDEEMEAAFQAKGEKMQAKLFSTINQVGSEGSYAYILMTSEDSETPVSSSAIDISSTLKRKLGITQ